VIIQQLFVYPVKSFAGIAVNSAQLSTSGLKADRQWMLVKDDGVFLTQRQAPQMATIKTQFEQGKLVLSADGMGSVTVDSLAVDNVGKASLEESFQAETLKIEVKVWRDTCEAYVAHGEVNQWINEALQYKKPVRLVQFAPDSSRQPYQVERFGHAHTKFADAAPFLVANIASLEALNAKLSADGLEEVPMDRFRPNIVIDGIPAFEEHKLAQIQQGQTKLDMVDHCSRCAIITVDQSTGVKSLDNLPFAK